MIHLLSPGSSDQRTGGYRYNARLVAEWRALGRAVAVHELPGRWPFPREEALERAAAVVAGLTGVVLADGLLWTALAPRVDRPVIVLIHSPLWREHGLAAKAREEIALRRAHAVVCTSSRIAQDLHLETPPTVVEPGTDPAAVADRPGTGALLCVANVVPRKGHDVLIEAVRRMDGAVTLRCAGALDRDSDYAAGVMKAALGLPVTWLGSLDDAALDAAYAQSDVLVSAARYEGFGMAIAEAWARGLPVISPPAGVFDGVGAGCGGVRVVPPDDPEALAHAITLVIKDSRLAEQLSKEARAIPLPSWSTQAKAWLTHLGGFA
ncbi:MAG: glycosyltransferase family 4 protein [Myxococcota bacterium]